MTTALLAFALVAHAVALIVATGVFISIVLREYKRGW